jgi:hypothetical protein
MTCNAGKIRTGLIFLFCLMVTVGPAHGADGIPKAVLPQNVIDFGVAYEGVDIFQDILIKNDGDADLEIVRIGTG